MIAAPLVSLRAIRKVYDNRTVLRGIDLSVGPGECVALTGANGSGKTTLLRIVAGLAKPSGGDAIVAGYSLTHDANVVRAKVGYVGHLPLIYADLTVEENLDFYAAMYGVANPRARISVLLALVGLVKQAKQRGKVISRGQAQRLALARALIHEPRVLLLDEPETGLDIAARDILRDVLAEQVASGGCAIIATHEPERLAGAMTSRVQLRGGLMITEGAVAGASPSVAGSTP